jgi:hypothetical protein
MLTLLLSIPLIGSLFIIAISAGTQPLSGSLDRDIEAKKNLRMKQIALLASVINLIVSIIL